MTERDELPEWPTGASSARSPLPIAPVPAAAAQRDLRGQRIIVGLPGTGWRADLRADSPVVQGSRTFVPVLTEHDWYRAEAEQTEVFAPLVPIERVWVELPADTEVAANDRRTAQLDAPPWRVPIPLLDGSRVTGRRVISVAAEKDERDLRAVTEPYRDQRHTTVVRVVAELDWYRWAWGGLVPKTREVDAELLWIE